jgi:peptide/nickel transport system substrate-binding protein
MNTAATVGGSPNPFANKTIRQAVCYGIDWGSILNLYGGLYTRAYQPVTSDFYAFNPTAPKYDFNLTMAQSLLKQANFVSGTPITFVIYAGRLTSERDIVVSSLQNLGFVVNLKIVDSSVFYSNYMIAASTPEDPNYPWNITMQSNGAGIPDPGPVYRSYLYSTTPTWNPGHFSDPSVDALIDKGDASTDPTERTQIYQQLAAKFVDAAVYPGTYSITDPFILQNNLVNWKPHPIYQNLVNTAYLAPTLGSTSAKSSTT